MSNRFSLSPGSIDWVLMLLLSALLLCGLMVLHSATGGDQFFVRQAWFVVIFLGMMLVISHINIGAIRLSAPLFYGAGLVLLFATLLFGTEINNARRWLDIGVRIQPSELMKVAVPLMLAWFYSLTDRVRMWHHIVAGFLLAMPVALIFQQPDLGTSLLVLVAGVVVIFLAGLSWWLIGFGTLAVAAAAPLAWVHVLKDYQKQRIITIIDPYQDPLGAGYHTIQSAIAVGSGGYWGKGWGQGTQAQLGFLPERHTDFIFAVFAEEFGLVGSLSLLALNLLLVFKGLAIAWSAPTRFGRLSASAIILVYFFYVFVNLGMVSGMLPVVGLPLPFVSYGGTALFSLFAGFGILMCISSSRKASGPR